MLEESINRCCGSTSSSAADVIRRNSFEYRLPFVVYSYVNSEYNLESNVYAVYLSIVHEKFEIKNKFLTVHLP